jgi:hypothetical protein
VVLSGTPEGDPLFRGIPRTVAGDGAVEYRTPGGTFVDRGSEVVVESADPEVAKVAFTVARTKFGASLKVDAGYEVLAAAGVGVAREDERQLPLETTRERGRARDG